MDKDELCRLGFISALAKNLSSQTTRLSLVLAVGMIKVCAPWLFVVYLYFFAFAGNVFGFWVVFWLSFYAFYLLTTLYDCVKTNSTVVALLASDAAYAKALKACRPLIWRRIDRENDGWHSVPKLAH